MESAYNKMIDSLSELWSDILRNFPNVILSICIIIAGIFLARLIARLFKKSIQTQNPDPLMVNFLTKSLRLLLIVLIVIFSLKVAGFGEIATGIFAAAGASAVILGFAFRDIGENFISGVILSFNRPFDLNDTVQIGDIFGKVKAMEFRYTKLKTFDGKDVYIPNSDVIKKPVYNYTEDGYFRLDFEVGIAYEDDIAAAEKVILEAVAKTPNVYQDDTHEMFISVDKLDISTVNLKVRFWVETLEYRKQALQIKSDVISNVKKVIIEKGFNLPADIKEIKLYGSQKAIPVEVISNKSQENKMSE